MHKQLCPGVHPRRRQESQGSTKGPQSRECQLCSPVFSSWRSQDVSPQSAPKVQPPPSSLPEEVLEVNVLVVLAWLGLRENQLQGVCGLMPNQCPVQIHFRGFSATLWWHHLHPEPPWR